VQAQSSRPQGRSTPHSEPLRCCDVRVPGLRLEKGGGIACRAGDLKRAEVCKRRARYLKGGVHGTRSRCYVVAMCERRVCDLKRAEVLQGGEGGHAP